MSIFNSALEVIQEIWSHIKKLETFVFSHRKAVKILLDVLIVSSIVSVPILIIEKFTRLKNFTGNLDSSMFSSSKSDINPFHVLFAAMTGWTVGYVAGNTAGESGVMAAVIPMILGLVGGVGVFGIFMHGKNKLWLLQKRMLRQKSAMGFAVLICFILGSQVGVGVKSQNNTLQIKRNNWSQICITLYSNHWHNYPPMKQIILNQQYRKRCKEVMGNLPGQLRNKKID